MISTEPLFRALDQAAEIRRLHPAAIRYTIKTVDDHQSRRPNAGGDASAAEREEDGLGGLGDVAGQVELPDKAHFLDAVFEGQVDDHPENGRERVHVLLAVQMTGDETGPQDLLDLGPQLALQDLAPRFPGHDPPQELPGRNEKPSVRPQEGG